MKLAVCQLESVSPYSQNRYYQVEMKEKELAKNYEERTWRERCHSNPNGNIFIPPMAFANSLKESALYLSLPIPGKQRQTFTKHFQAGVMVESGIILPEKRDTVKGEWILVPSDGKRGGGRRVAKCFPLIESWKGKVTYVILDDMITEEAFREVLETSGSLIGIGRFRPRNLGYYGRFECKDMSWET